MRKSHSASTDRLANIQIIEINKETTSPIVRMPEHEFNSFIRATLLAAKRYLEIPGKRAECNAWITKKCTALIQEAQPEMKAEHIKIDLSSILDTKTEDGQSLTTTTFTYHDKPYMLYDLWNAAPPRIEKLE